METILAMIFMIAVEVGVPPNFAISIARVENSSLNPLAVSQPNSNGTVDLGIFQLNNAYFGHIDWQCPETNIRAGVEHIRWLMEQLEGDTFWSVAVSYNAGLSRLNNPPESSIEYASKVLALYWELSGGTAPVFVYFPRR
ncbi:MAG: lytic transglycosylase domain-containing protein [Treponema sp.]|nr:lytic transglycosylase domain-containing protein [Treponema sp.]